MCYFHPEWGADELDDLGPASLVVPSLFNILRILSLKRGQAHWIK
jgi:hypothetical protein